LLFEKFYFAFRILLKAICRQLWSSCY